MDWARRNSDDEGTVMPARRRSAQLGNLLATPFLTAACGTPEPDPFKPMEPEMSADLGPTVRATLGQGLISTSDADPSGNPRLRARSGRRTLRLLPCKRWRRGCRRTTTYSADEVWDSQCSAIDGGGFTGQTRFQARGADKACAVIAAVDGAGCAKLGATCAAVSNCEVVTVRLSSPRTGRAPVVTRAKAMLEVVLDSVAGDS